MKTSNDILGDVYELVKSSPINDLDGEIYRGVRKTDSEVNDCVISLISGSTAKFLQSGAIYVKIFVKDLFIQNSYYPDYGNLGIMESLLFDLSAELLSKEGYSFDIQSREIYSEPVQEVKEHYSILKLNFQL